MSAQPVYDFESILSSAFAAVYTAQQLVAVNLNTNPTLQKPRPRVDLLFRVTGIVVPPIMIPPGITGDFIRPGAYRGDLSVEATTDVTEEGKSVHGAYRAQVRSIGSILGQLVNNVAPNGLQYHKVQFVIESGTSYKIFPEKGYEQSTFSYLVDFSINSDAWALLQQP